MRASALCYMLLGISVFEGAFATAIPCDQASDFNGDADFGGGQKCKDIAPLLLPSSPAQCSLQPHGGPSKADMLKTLYTKCCKPGSKPNGMCGFKLTYPCEQASDFTGSVNIGGGQTCNEVVALGMPSSPAECSVSVGGAPTTKGDMLKGLYTQCCKAGSKPNGVCGFKLTYPCENASDFNGDVDFGNGQKCKVMSAMAMPSSPAECSLKPDGTTTKADMLKSLHTKCCNVGSKPNGVCGLTTSGTTTQAPATTTTKAPTTKATTAAPATKATTAAPTTKTTTAAPATKATTAAPTTKTTTAAPATKATTAAPTTKATTAAAKSTTKATTPSPKPVTKTCYSVGDPHLKSFSGARFDNHAVGWQTLYAKGGLKVEAEQAKWRSGNAGVAINRAYRVTYNGQVTQGNGGQMPVNGGVMEFASPAVKVTVKAADYRRLSWAVDKYIYNIFVTTAETDGAAGMCVGPPKPKPARHRRLGTDNMPFPSNPKVTKEQAVAACASLADQSDNCEFDIRMANDVVAVDMIAENFKQVEKTVKALEPVALNLRVSAAGALEAMSALVSCLFVAIFV